MIANIFNNILRYEIFGFCFFPLTLAAEAERSIGVIEFVPQVGDFVARDEALFHLYGTAQAIDDNKLRSAVAFGSERTMEQDPTFAFRIIVDIALKALSPAINDPTTAVLAIDQLHRMLRLVGKRNLRTDEISDSTGQLRLIFRTPNWEDFVSLAFSEIRSCGSSNLKIVRRVRAMIENLIQTLPDYRHAALKRQLNLLDLEVKRIYKYPEELKLAYVADTQGLHAGQSRHRHSDASGQLSPAGHHRAFSVGKRTGWHRANPRRRELVRRSPPTP